MEKSWPFNLLLLTPAAKIAFSRVWRRRNREWKMIMGTRLAFHWDTVLVPFTSTKEECQHSTMFF
jgi:hypothetical protein